MAGEVTAFSFLKKLRPDPVNVKAAAFWGVAAGTGALWFVQPFDWIKKTFFETPEPEK